MTNILLLPQLDGPNTIIGITRNADWVDSLPFAVPGSLPSTVLAGCQTSSGSNVITVPATNVLADGMPIVQGPQIPPGAYVGALLSSTTFQMVAADESSLPAIITDTAAVLTFLALPLDITGIVFIANLRASNRVYLTAQTSQGTLLNGGTNGTLSFAVPQAQVAVAPAGTYALDILAIADGKTVNLFPSGPATVTLVDGASDANLLIQQ